mgnify:CR=1 FL=1|tara:strand:+ start:7510 stop:7881 length:372 start_codon:yes stop_codon:yes gene_type:complete
MAKKQKSFTDKAAGLKDADAVYVKYVNSVKSDKTGAWRFNEKIIKTRKGEQLDAALKRLDEAANLVDIDLSEFELTDSKPEENITESENLSEDSVKIQASADSQDETENHVEDVDEEGQAEEE